MRPNWHVCSTIQYYYTTVWVQPSVPSVSMQIWAHEANANLLWWMGRWSEHSGPTWVDLPLICLIPSWSAPHTGSNIKIYSYQLHYQRLSGDILLLPVIIPLWGNPSGCLGKLFTTLLLHTLIQSLPLNRCWNGTYLASLFTWPNQLNKGVVPRTEWIHNLMSNPKVIFRQLEQSMKYVYIFHALRKLQVTQCVWQSTLNRH